jgi:outer membrane protein TolC
MIQTKAANEFKGSISARIGLNALGDDVKNMYDNPTDNEQIGISLSIPIFDWGAKKARIKSTEISMESNKISFEEEKKNITLSIRQLCRNLPTLIRQIEIKKQSMENAERTYEINMEKYRNGNLTGMELQQYQSQLTSAKQTYTNSLISYKLELLNLKIQTLWDFEKNQSYLPVDLLK